MSLADKIVKVAIEGMPINPLEKLFIKFVLGTKLGRKILLKRMKKNWKSAFAKKGKVDKKKADKATKGQVDKGKVAKGIVSTNKKRWPTIFDKVILDEKPNTPKSPYEVHLNGENIISDKEENETSELLRKILLITKPKALGEGVVSDKDAEMPEMLRKILSLRPVVKRTDPKTPKNPYEVRIDGKLKTAQEILKDITNASLKDALKDMHRENDYKVLHDILGDNINVKIESLEDLYAGKKETKEDEKKAVNPYSDEALEKRGLEMHIFEVSIGGLGRPLIPGVPEPMAGYQERPVAIGGVKDHICMFNGKPVYELGGRYYYTEIVPKGTKPKKGFLTKKAFLKMNNVDTNKDHSIDLEHLKDEIQKLREQNKELTGLKPWQHRLPDGTIVATGALIDPAMEKVIMPDGKKYATGVRRDPAREADDQNAFKFVDREARQIILSDGTVVKLATSEAEKPTKEQIINPDQNKKLEKNPWVIHLDKVAQNFQKHEDYFKQKYGLTLDGGAIMPAHTNDISSTLVATKGGRQ